MADLTDAQLLDAEMEAKTLMDAAGELGRLAQERDTARELAKSLAEERDYWKALALAGPVRSKVR